MERAGNSARFMLKPHCATVGAIALVYADYPGWPPPFVARFLGSLFASKHDHIADPVRAGDRLGAVKCRFFHFFGAIEMHEILSALGSHFGSSAEGCRGVDLSTDGSKAGVLFFLKKGAWHSSGSPEYPLRRAKTACLALLVFRCSVHVRKLLDSLLSYD